MYSIVDLCFLCLTDNENRKCIKSKDKEGIVIEEKCIFVLQAHVNIIPEVSYICLQCLKNLNYVYTFKQMCIQNINKFNNYVDTLGTNKHLKVTVTDVKYEKWIELTFDNEAANEMSSPVEVQEEIADDSVIQVINGLEEEQAMHKYEQCSGQENCGTTKLQFCSSLFEDRYVENFLKKVKTETNFEIVHEEIHIKDEQLLEATDSDSDDNSNDELQNEVTSNAKSSDVDTTVVSAIRKTCKKQACLFCNKLFVQLPRHFRIKHSTHPTVQKMMSLKHNEEKQKILTQLRKEGNFAYNSRVLETGKDQLIVKRRSGKHPKPSNEFLPCTNCLGFYSKKALFRHMNYCDENKRKYSRVQANSSNLLPISKYASAVLKENVFSTMHTDNVTFVVKGDDLILQYGSNLCENQAANNKSTYYVSQKMRVLGRLIIVVKQVNGEHLRLSELIDPKYFDLIVESIRILACYDSDTGEYKNPSIAHKLGISLEQCVTILKASAIRCCNEILRKRCDDFIFLFRNEWNVKIGRLATKNINKKTKRVPWSCLEIAALKRHMSHFMQSREVPGMEDCQNCIKTEPDLRNRTWKHVKYWVYNYIRKYK